MSLTDPAREGRKRPLLRRAQFFPRPGRRDFSKRMGPATTARMMATLETKIAKQALVSRTLDGYIVEFEGTDAALSPRQRLSWTWRYLVNGLRLSIWELPRLREGTVSGLTDIAVLLAGRKRTALRDEWRAHLAGESGHDPATWPKVRQALGFVAAAIQLRLADAADLAWRPADAVLGSRTLSNLFVWGPVIVAAMAIVRRDGRYGLVADDQQLAELGGSLYLVIRTGRWWRGVKPPAPKARRATE